jgi:hypothetical protein
MNLFEYYALHVLPTSMRSIASSFRNWKDLMTGNYAEYALLKSDDPFQECHGWFWATLGVDETLPRDFLDYLQELVQEIEDGKVDLIPFDPASLELSDP